MLLRSGRHLTFASSCSQPITMSEPSPSSSIPLPPPSTPSLTPTIRLLHQTPSFKPFSGEDASSSALTFLESCEDSMRNSNVTNDADKISFVRSNIKPDSLASDMMQASSFTPKLLNYDYAVFRENFLKTFGSTKHHDSMQWTFRLADALTSQLGTSNYLRGQARAANVANEAIDALNSASWLNSGTLTESRLRSLIEFLVYIQFLSPNERRIASSLDFKPGDSLMDYGNKIAKKLREAPKASPTDSASHATPVAPVHHQPSAPLLCTFCSRKGHHERNCFRRKRLIPKAPISPDVSGSQPSAARRPNTPASTPHSDSHSSATSSSSPTKWCVVHGHTFHSSEECRLIHTLRQPRLGSSSRFVNPSGEATRHRQNPPS